jgi:hypothetical protein
VAASAEDDLQADLEKLHERVRDEFAPLAFLYELRIHGGLAHHPNMIEAAKAAAALGFPESGWHRSHYLNLLKRLTGSISEISEHLENGATQA